MKNDDQMYQSVLSRYAEYQETKKRRRKLAIKRTVPVLACFCLTIALGVGYWDHFRNLPHIPVQPNIIEEPTIETPDTTTASTDANTTVGSETPSEPASTTAPTTNSETERMTTTAGVQTQTVTTVVTDATEAPTTEQVVKQTETQAPATTPPATYTQPITDSPVITTEATSAPFVTEPITTTDSESPEPISSPAQPLSFRSITDMKDAIQNNDVSSYYEEYQDQYRKMFERFNNDGYFYQPVTDESITFRPNYSTLLYPYEQFRDIGIKYCLTYNGKQFNVYFYCADIAVVNETNGIEEYLDIRKGEHNDTEYNINDQTYSIHISGDGSELSASWFVDDGHYCTVVANTSEEVMKEFLSKFRYEQIPL
jgi:cytoskeletal protein RodZ